MGSFDSLTQLTTPPARPAPPADRPPRPTPASPTTPAGTRHPATSVTTTSPTSTRRRKIRHPFEIYQDQLDTLRERAYHERRGGKTGSMSQMVRDALDSYLRKPSPVDN